MILSKEEFAKGIDQNIFPGAQGGAINNQIAAKAVCFKEAMSEEYKSYAQQILDNAHALAESFKAEGLRVVSGGTSNHIVLVDTGSVDDELTGKEAAEVATATSDSPVELAEQAAAAAADRGGAPVTSY